MKTWQKATFIIVLIAFIIASVTISFVSMARAPFEYEYQTALDNESIRKFNQNIYISICYGHRLQQLL